MRVSVDKSIQRADRLRNQLAAESAMKVADAKALRMRLRAHGQRLLAVADLHLDHARDLQKQKDGPSAKALRAYKSAWKAASKSAKDLLEATDHDENG